MRWHVIVSYRHEKYAKSLERSQLSDSHLEDSMRVATTTFEPSSVARGAGRLCPPLADHYYAEQRKKCKMKHFCGYLNYGEGSIFFSLFHPSIYFRLPQNPYFATWTISKNSDLCISCVSQNKFLLAIYKNPLIYENKRPIFFNLHTCNLLGR